MASELKRRMNGHEQYEELAALYPTGALGHDEVEALTEHVRHCESCRLELAEYRQLFQNFDPIDSRQEGADLLAEQPWKSDPIKERTLAHFQSQVKGTSAKVSPINQWARPPWNGKNRIAIYMIATLMVTVGLFAIGKILEGRTHTDLQAELTAAQATQADLRSKLSLVTADRDKLMAELGDRTAAASAVSRRLTSEEDEISHLRARIEEFAKERDGAIVENDRLQATQAASIHDEESATRRAQDAETSLVAVQQRMNELQTQHIGDLVQSNQLQSQVKDLTAQLKEQQSLLESDRDIRELIGARELTIATVYDFDQNAKKQKPFGRVFFTKDKSLIFYAFDLDKQRGVHNVSAFQAWGVDGLDKTTPVNLGILYQDNKLNRRWVLRFDKPEILERIDAIFVTVEPKGGSQKPSGEQLMYASLRTQPNHP
jgi:hypothetical protein